jgi:flavin reductase (DIM6/NTAB) family NADH-FMN oxidoreductase RutF
MIGISPLQKSEPAVSDAVFRTYCRKLAAGVAVVTACGPSGWSGTTVSTVTSVSMDPPVLLCCVSRGSGTLAAIRYAGRFAVHLLTADQPELADRFSRPAGNGSRFAGMGSQVRLIGGTPVIAGALAVAWCDLYSLAEIGDHIVVYGRSLDVQIGCGDPLLWHERAYRRVDTVRSPA